MRVGGRGGGAVVVHHAPQATTKEMSPSHQGDRFEMRVSVPTDEDGFFGRECPECSMIFRIDGDDYEVLPDDLTLWCVYCGHHDELSHFLTTQQRERLTRAVGDLGMQMISRGLSEAFRGLSRGSSRRGALSFSVCYKEKPFYPRPLPGIDEERLARIRTCAQCQVRYAVFGEHRYCPVCGPLPAASVAFDALQADTARLDALDSLPPDATAVLREQGVFTRSWVDTIENVVGVVEALGSSVFRSAVPDAEDRLKGKGNVFQRLDDMAPDEGPRLLRTGRSATRRHGDRLPPRDRRRHRAVPDAQQLAVLEDR